MSGIQSIALFFGGVSFTIFLELLGLRALLAPIEDIFEAVLGLRGN